MSKIKSKHNNLLNYFLYDHKYLSKEYLRKSKKFLKELTTGSKNEKMKKGTVINYKGTEIKIPFDIAVPAALNGVMAVPNACCPAPTEPIP